MRIALLFSFIIIFSCNVLAQLSDAEVKYFSAMEDSLKHVKDKVFFSKKESARFEANKQFLASY